METGARIVKSLVFWGLAAILASSVYTDIAKLGGKAETHESVETAADARENGLAAALAEDAESRATAEAFTEDAESRATAEALAEDAESRATTEAFTEDAENRATAEAFTEGAESRATTEALAEDAENRATAEVFAEDAEGRGLAGVLKEDAPGGETAGAMDDEDDTSQEQKRVALTFDDGPHPVYTKKLLDGLAERNVRATFFVVGKNISGNEDLIRRMEAEGHLIGNHTYDHVKICDISGEDACEQVEKTSALVREITGHDTEFVRPPFGAWNKDMECSFIMIPVLWDVDPLDWTTKNSDIVVQRVLKDTENEDIILLHDYYDSSVEAALQIVDRLSEQGYEFVTVDELILA